MARYRYDFWSSDGRKVATVRSNEKSDDVARELDSPLLSKNGHGSFARPRRSARVRYLPPREVTDLAELEFGDHGRDPRFLPGWWILPTLLLGFALMIWIVSLSWPAITAYVLARFV
jgi:hypothetical protein